MQPNNDLAYSLDLNPTREGIKNKTKIHMEHLHHPSFKCVDLHDMREKN